MPPRLSTKKIKLTYIEDKIATLMPQYFYRIIFNNSLRLIKRGIIIPLFCMYKKNCVK